MAEAEYLTPQQIADTYQVKLATVYVWLQDGKLRGVKVGDLWRVRRSDMDDFLKQPK